MNAVARSEGARTDVARQQITPGRLAMYFGLRYATPFIVLGVLAATGQAVRVDRLTALLTAQVAFSVITHALALKGARAASHAVSLAMFGDVAAISGVVVMTGGVAGPLVFLFTLNALGAGILLSSRAGARMLMLSTIGIVASDMAAHASGVAANSLPKGVEAAAALWLIGGLGTLFSSHNERELRRRAAELTTVARVTADIERSLSLEDVLADLCAGVVDGFRFDVALVLQGDDDALRCTAAHGVSVDRENGIARRGPVARALSSHEIAVVSSAEAGKDGALAQILGTRGYVVVPIDASAVLIATRGGRRRRPGVVRAHELEALQRLAHHASLAIANARLHQRVTMMAKTDPLTGVANHGEMQRLLVTELGKIKRFTSHRRSGAWPSLLLLDIDHFKGFNDRYGHQAGDAVLRGVARTLAATVRSFDIVARYGGEEFAVILPATDAEQAREVAERVRRAIATIPFRTQDGAKVRVTVSVGIATAPGCGETPEALISDADSALYAAKENGRNCVVLASEIVQETAQVVNFDPMRRRRERAERPAADGARHVRGRSSRPTRRTPRA